MFGMEEEATSPIIPGASYFIYVRTLHHEVHDIFGPGLTSTVIFYSATGDELEKVEEDTNFYEMQSRLDPNAPKPQPTRFAVKYFDGHVFNVKIIVNKTSRLVCPAYFIVFYDKHGNVIKYYDYDVKTKKTHIFLEGELCSKPLKSIHEIEELDTSIVQESGSDPLDMLERPRPKKKSFKKF